MDEMNATKPRAQKPKKAWRFNILDVAIIAVAVLFVAAVIMIMFPQTAEIFSGDRVGITYTVVFVGVDERFAANIADGQAVTDSATGKVIGTVTGTPTTEPYYEFVLKENEGDIAMLEREQYTDIGKVNLTVTMTAEAEYAEGRGYEVNGSRIACDREYTLIFPEFTGVGVCSMFTVSEEED